MKKRFDPSFEIAESWERLIIGKNIKPHALTLLKHAEKERELIKQGHTQDEAHILASKIYNYSGEVYIYYHGTTKNINKTKDYIEWDYFPEDSKENGYIKMSLINDFEILEERLHPWDKRHSSYTLYKRMSKNHLNES